MNHQIVYDERKKQWLVQASEMIDGKSRYYNASFYGEAAEERAKEYAEWKNKVVKKVLAKPLPELVVKYTVQFDGSYDYETGKGGFGFTITRSSSEDLPMTYSYYGEMVKVNGIGSCNVAEWQGLIASLAAIDELAVSFAGLAKFEIEIQGDSKLVVEQANGNWKCKQEHLRRLRGVAKKLVGGSPVLSNAKMKIKWVPREQNSFADELSNYYANEKESSQSVDAPQLIELPERVVLPDRVMNLLQG